MQLQHTNTIATHYSNKRTLSIGSFNDERPAAERMSLPPLDVQPIKPVIYSGNAQPPLTDYLRQVIAQEIQRSGLFTLAAKGEYKLSGRILSLKAGEMGGPYLDDFYMEPGTPRPLFTPMNLRK